MIGQKWPQRWNRTFARKDFTRRKLLVGGAGFALVAGSGRPARVIGQGRVDGLETAVRLTLVRADPPDPHADTLRQAPLTMPGLPFEIVAVHGPGDVTISRSLVAGFHAAYPDVAHGQTAYVSTAGDDTVAAIGDAARPFASLDGALRSEATLIVLEDGPHAPPNYRRSGHPAPPRLIKARNPGRARLEMPGDDLARSEWVADGDLWRTTLKDARVGGDLVHRVTRADIRGRSGFPLSLRKQPSLAALRSARSGWFVDVRSRILHVAAERPVPELKADLKAYYFDAANNARLICEETILCLHGVDLHGLNVWAYHHEDGVAHPAVWLSHFTSLFSPDYGAQASVGGEILMESGRIHAPAKDGYNADYGDHGGLVVAAGVHFTDAGDVEGLGPPARRNIQAGSSHSGPVAVFACLAERSAGQHFADTSRPSSPNVSWYVGNEVRGGEIGFHCVGMGEDGPGSRMMFLDTNRTVGSDRSLVLEARGRARLFNNRFEGQPEVRDVTAGPRTYAPDGPPVRLDR